MTRYKGYDIFTNNVGGNRATFITTARRDDGHTITALSVKAAKEIIDQYERLGYNG